MKTNLENLFDLPKLSKQHLQDLAVTAQNRGKTGDTTGSSIYLLDTVIEKGQLGATETARIQLPVHLGAYQGRFSPSDSPTKSSASVVTAFTPAFYQGLGFPGYFDQEWDSGKAYLSESLEKYHIDMFTESGIPLLGKEQFSYDVLSVPILEKHLDTHVKGFLHLYSDSKKLLDGGYVPAHQLETSLGKELNDYNALLNREGEISDKASKSDVVAFHQAQTALGLIDMSYQKK